MIEKTVDGVTYLEFSLLKDIKWIKHCFSTRIGGVSQGVYESMNFTFRPGEEKNVPENYRRLCEAVGFTYTALTFSDQKHGTNIRRITRHDKGKGFYLEKDYRNIDGIVTNEAGIAMTTFHADCTPIFLVDTENKAIGLVHSGWRGTVDRIVENAVNEMVKEFGTKPYDILAGIGPCVSYDCFQVDYPVYEEFRQKFDFALKYSKEEPGIRDKYLIDLKGINRQMLMNMGVLEKNIEVSARCTKCDDRLFFSHRRQGLKRGSMVAMMEII